ncbi:GIY-YIG nuclease family protein [Patescibacteria group bacterium]
MKFHVYILQCSDNSLYCGSTNGLNRRLEQHQIGKGAKYTRARLPLTLVFQREFTTLKKARRYEREVKGWRREKKMELIKQGHLYKKSND